MPQTTMGQVKPVAMLLSERQNHQALLHLIFVLLILLGLILQTEDLGLWTIAMRARIMPGGVLEVTLNACPHLLL